MLTFWFSFSLANTSKPESEQLYKNKEGISVKLELKAKHKMQPLTGNCSIGVSLGVLEGMPYRRFDTETNHTCLDQC